LLSAETVYLPEGEKDVHTLEEWGFVASCNSGGSGSCKVYALWTGYFLGRHIVILVDNDLEGKKHAATVAEILLPVAASVRVVELPDLPEKGDVTDWRDAGGTPERLRELGAAAEALDSAGLSELRAQWGIPTEGPRRKATPVVEDTVDWPEPAAIQSELPPVEAFSVELLPASFLLHVRDVAERMQVPMDLPAIMTVLCLAGVVNRRAIIQPKAKDTGWQVVPNLWGGLIMPPGFMKSPVIAAATHPVSQIQAVWRRENEEELEFLANEKEEYDLRCAGWREEFKKSAKKGSPAPERPGEEPQQPKRRRLIVIDATFESLHEIMNENPAGVLVTRDELTGWLAGLDRPGREQERSFYLECWSGDTSFSVDRIGRGHIHVAACCLSMLGGIQPSRLRSYLADALLDGPGNDGLVQRFQLLVWPDFPSGWAYVDRPPDPDSERQAYLIFFNLVTMSADTPARFRFSQDAQALFIEWLQGLEAKVRGSDIHPALISHLSKYRSLMPSLALLFELAERASSDGFDGSSLAQSQNFVSLENARLAAAWCDYLESHAYRIYSCVVSPHMRAARELASKIRNRKVGAGGFFSCREVYVKGWSGLNSPEAVRHAAEILQDAGWLRELPGDSGAAGGRPSNRYQVNPKVWK
jgi:putative DNA primase/helicase